MLQLPLPLAQKDNALMTQLPHLTEPATRSKQPAEPREPAALMLPSLAPPTLALNRNVMPSEERTDHRDAGTQQLPLPPLLVP